MPLVNLRHRQGDLCRLERVERSEERIDRQGPCWAAGEAPGEGEDGDDGQNDVMGVEVPASAPQQPVLDIDPSVVRSFDVHVWGEHRSAAPTAEHEIDLFDSGQPTLDQWLQHKARTAHAQGSARSWVWTKAGSNRVVAYFSIAPTQVARTELTSSQAGGVSVVPAYLLARLALDQSLRGQGLGSELLVDALSRIVAAADVAGGRLIVVDAIDEAEGFYARHDFQPVRATENPAYPRRVVMKVATARRVLAP